MNRPLVSPGGWWKGRCISLPLLSNEPKPQCLDQQRVLSQICMLGRLGLADAAGLSWAALFHGSLIPLDQQAGQVSSFHDIGRGTEQLRPILKGSSRSLPAPDPPASHWPKTQGHPKCHSHTQNQIMGHLWRWVGSMQVGGMEPLEVGPMGGN